jgi:dGTPase
VAAGLYGEGDEARPVPDSDGKGREPFRSPWRRDYARLIHCPSFRRLQGKTQVFPGHESDFYRNRLTHSLEVAQIAKSIAYRLNATAEDFGGDGMAINPDIVEFAGLAHDLGHPPFGHNGEEALDECMEKDGGFEGNAQTLRIVGTLEKKKIDGANGPFGSRGEDHRRGLNLTYRSLASLLKYDREISKKRNNRPKAYRDRPMKGYYAEDRNLVTTIKERVTGDASIASFKTIECSIMDIADDIAYSTYDLEDNFKAGFLTPLGLLSLDDEVYEAAAKEIEQRIEKPYPEHKGHRVDARDVQFLLRDIVNDMLFGVDDDYDAYLSDDDYSADVKKFLVGVEVQSLSRKLACDGYQRVQFTSGLVQRFLEGIEVVPHAHHPQLHSVRLKFETFLWVEAQKNLTFHAVIRSPGMQVVEYRGKDIVKAIFETLAESKGERLLPDDFGAACKMSPHTRMRTICDFVAGMTDRYAMEFYSRLRGSGQVTVHKPL